MWIVAAFALAIAASGAQFVTAGTAAEGAAPTATVHHLFDLAVLGENPGRPVVLLDTDRAVPCESFTLDGPARLVLDLPGVISHLDRHSFTVGQAGVIRVRAGQFRSDPDPVTRVVFDLERPVGYRIAAEGEGLRVTFGGEAPASWGSGEPIAVVLDTEPLGETEVLAETAEAEAFVPAAPEPEPEPARVAMVAPAVTEPSADPEPEPAVEPEVEEPALVAVATTSAKERVSSWSDTEADRSEAKAVAIAEPRMPSEAGAASSPLAKTAVSEKAIEQLLAGAPELASTASLTPAQTATPTSMPAAQFETKRIITEETAYRSRDQLRPSP